MIIIKILGWLLLGLLALIILLVLLPVTVGIKGGLKTENDVWVRFAGITVWRKSKHRSDKKESKKIKPDKDTKDKDFVQTVRSVVQPIRIVATHLPRLLGKVRVKSLELECIAANSDAAECAMQYGLACSVLYPLIEYMRQKMHLKDKHTVLDIRCDFEREQPVFTIETEIFMKVGHIVYVLLRILSQKMKEDAGHE